MSSLAATAQKQRASVACHRCNSKKIRCNAAMQNPCTSCSLSNSECVLIESRRGKYLRKRRASNEGSRQPKRTRPRPWLPRPSRERSGSTSTQEDASGLLYAQVAESSTSPNQGTIHHGVRSVFLGETFSLTYVVHDVLAPFLSNTIICQRRLHVPLAEGMHGSSNPNSDRGRIVANQGKLLQRQRAHQDIPRTLADVLLNVYFDSFHPAYPIVDRSMFANIDAVEKQSQLVWNAMLMLAVTLCDEEVLQTAGFAGRHKARAIFYRRARCIFDADAEPDSLDNIRGTFLMSFWWGGPNDIKDSKHWLGSAITLAQSLGLHRTTATSNIDPAQSRDWKRIWWCLRVRDTLISASIGRPQLAWPGDCDVELPSFDDLLEQLPGSDDETASYFIQMAKLSVIVSRIIHARYACANLTPSIDNRHSLENALVDFRDGIPQALRYSGVDPKSRRGLWAAMLAMAHGYTIVLLFRPHRANTGLEDVQHWGDPRKAIAAANEITRATEDLLSASLMNLCQVHAIMALFNALAMHVYVVCTSQALTRGLAEARAQVCMMGLTVLQESWPVGGWVLKLFDSIMMRLGQPRYYCGPTQGSRGWTQSAPDTHLANYVELPRAPGNIQGTTGALLPHPRYDISSAAQQNNGDADHVIPDASTVSDIGGQWDSELDFNLMPNIFAFNDATGGLIADQESFFQWLDVPSIPRPAGWVWQH